MISYDTLHTEAWGIKGKNIRNAALAIIDSARINANDTTSFDNDRQEWERVFIASCGGLLSERGVFWKVVRWFENRGVRG